MNTRYSRKSLSRESNVTEPAAKACDNCRAKKRKCDWEEEQNICSVCRRLGVSCSFTHVRKQAPRTRRKRLEALEQKFSDLEDQLARHIRNSESVSIDPEIRAVSLAKRATKQPVQYDTEVNEPARPSLASSVPFDSRRQEPVRLLRSPDIVMNIDNHVGQPEVDREEVHPDGSWIQFDRTSTYSENMTPSSGTQETWMLVQEYLEDFNCAIPLFDKNWVKSTFIQLYVDCGTPPKNSPLAFHIILAMAYRLRAQSPVSSIEDDLQGREHLKYACSQLGDLLIQEPSLTQVQCLVGIAAVIQGTSASERTAAIISAALRLIQQLCACSLSEAGVGSPEEEHQLETVFWIAFIMEVSICLRTRQTPTINIYDDHIEQSAKRPCNLGKISTMNNDETFDIFQAHVQLAILQTKVLASITPPLLTKGGLYSAANSFQTLCQDFRAWRQSFPAAMSSSGMCYTFHRSDIIHIFVLEAKAFETVCALHGISNETLEELKHDQLSGGGRALSFISEDSLIVEEAKRFLNLAALAPRGDVACNRLSLGAFVSAAFVMLVRTVRCPSSVSAESDIALAQSALLQVKELVDSSESGNMIRSLQACLSLQSLAENLIIHARSERKSSYAAKRG